MLHNSYSPTPDGDRINSTLWEYNVQSEEEYQILVDETWHQVKCIRCGKQISLLHCHFDHGDPCCAGGCR
jgi:hypothetical protein